MLIRILAFAFLAGFSCLSLAQGGYHYSYKYQYRYHNGQQPQVVVTVQPPLVIVQVQHQPRVVAVQLPRPLVGIVPQDDKERCDVWRPSVYGERGQSASVVTWGWLVDGVMECQEVYRP